MYRNLGVGISARMIIEYIATAGPMIQLMAKVPMSILSWMRVLEVRKLLIACPTMAIQSSAHIAADPRPARGSSIFARVVVISQCSPPNAEC